jgi:hypothetical protein
VNGSTKPGQTKSTAKTGTENGTADQDDSDDDKEDEVETGETGAPGGYPHPHSQILHQLMSLSGQEEEKEEAEEEEGGGGGGGGEPDRAIRPASSPHRTTVSE